MASVTNRALARMRRLRCCPPPPQVTGLTAVPGGGSGEVVITWDPLGADDDVAFYRVYEQKGAGLWWHLAVVTSDALGALAPGRLGLVDAPDYWPWPTGGAPAGPRCYTVSAVSRRGLEGPMSTEVCASPPGGTPSA